MANIEVPAVRPLGPDDLDAALALTRAAGWNQNADDWRFMLEMGEGFGIRVADAVVATAIALPYDDFGWISMVLTAAEHRRRGLATRLLHHCIARLEARGLVPGLDATPAGQAVYVKLGFRPIYGMKRFVLERAVDAPPPPWGVAVRRVQPQDLTELAAYDAPVFGADRSALIAHLLQRRAPLAWIARGGGQIVGYCLGREGADALQIGPVVADHAAIALGLAARAAEGARRPIYVDCPDAQVPKVGWLGSHGAAAQRPLARMLKARNAPFDDANRIYAFAGPELG